MKKEQNRGITLIALVITIIVLLILAAISIATLTGPNGLLTQTELARTKTKQSEVEEKVRLAINALQTKNLGDTSKITPSAIAQEVNESDKRTDVTAEGTEFPTNIVFPEEGLKVQVNLDLSIGDITSGGGTTGPQNPSVPEGMYKNPEFASKIAPTDLFDFEKIEDETSSKKARITRIKPEYCNKNGYNPDTYNNDLTDTNYEIDYKGTKISDTLVIPYEVELEGEMYQIAEVCLTFTDGYGFPGVETVVYPNTVEKLISTRRSGTDDYEEMIGKNIVKNIILSDNISEIPDSMFEGFTSLQTVSLSKKLIEIRRFRLFEVSFFAVNSVSEFFV